MKLISLNVWGGTLYNPLLKFIEEQSNYTDIFCFQEMFHSSVSKTSNGIKTDLYSNATEILKDYVGFFAPMFTGYDTHEKVNFDLAFGQATFIKKSVELLSEETIFVHGKFDHKPPIEIEGIIEGLDLPRNIHLIKIRKNGKEVLIGNFHGYWIPGQKIDSPKSIAQMEVILKIYNSFRGPRIIAGDFNLREDTKSLGMLEKSMRNLIKDFGIKTTRSKYYKKTAEKFADYILVSDDVKVNNFEVINKEISDHLPLLLNFSV